MPQPMIEAEALSKRFGDTQALAGVSFAAPQGSILGVLGPNGAGKTTAVRILTTLTQPDSGSARVAGIDVLAHPGAARQRLGVAAQAATLDENLTGRQNLEMVGLLSRMPAAEVKRRATDLLSTVELSEAADRVLKTYSGGMRRRADVAASMMGRPQVLFLDEPTTGLDPASRYRLWSSIQALVGDGATVLLTTQYLDEADRLADHIVIVDHGRVVSEGTPSELKRVLGGAQLEVTLRAAHSQAVSVLQAFAADGVRCSDDGLRLSATVRTLDGIVPRVVRALDHAGINVADVAVHEPSLDDVFMRLTGHAAEAVEVSA